MRKKGPDSRTPASQIAFGLVPLALLALVVLPATPCRGGETSDEIDATVWEVISTTVAANDLEGMAVVYHPDAVLVSPRGTVSIAEQLEKWGEGMERIGREGRSASVSFRFASRQDGADAAFERGMFRYAETDEQGVEQPHFIPFEALLVKKGGRWLMVMERQLEATGEGAWNALAITASGAVGSDTSESEVTRESFKYLDGYGQIRFAPSWEAVPEAYRFPRHWGLEGWCGKVEQSIELQDVDADGDNEVLVYFDDECPNKRQFATLQVIEADDRGEFSIIATVRAHRGWRPEPIDLDGDGRFELLGRHWGGAPELWLWRDGEWVDLVLGGTCFGTFWEVAVGKPLKPLEEDLARVLEIYRQGECRRDPPSDLWERQ